MSTNIDDYIQNKQKKAVIDAYNTMREWCKEYNDCASCPFYGLQPYYETPQCEFTRSVVPEGWEPVKIRITDSGSKKKDSEKITDDSVNHLSHYNSNEIDIIDFIEDKGLDYCLGKAVIHISTGQSVKNLQKSIWYINKKIQSLERVGNDK